MLVKYFNPLYRTNNNSTTMSSDEELPSAMFALPQDYRTVTKKGKELTYKMPDGSNLQVHLLGASPLYGHILTNACKDMVKYLETNSQELVKDKNVLEFGSGSGLPSMICARLGASMAVATDYPDADLVSNIQSNIEHNNLTNNCKAVGYIWGNDPNEIREALTNGKTFDLILLSDVIFNHTEQYKLLDSCRKLITPKTGKILVTFTPHRPWLLNADLDFFHKCTEHPYCFKPKFIHQVHYSPLFKDDHDETTVEIRSRVYLHILTDAL